MQSSCFFVGNELSNSTQFLPYPKQIVFLHRKEGGINGKITNFR